MKTVDNKKAIYKALQEGYIRTKHRCIATVICALGWFVFSFLHEGFTNADGWVTIILLSIAVVYAESFGRKQLIIKKADKLGYNKNIKYPAGSYKTICGLINREGESLDELFARRDKAIEKRIRNARPFMSRIKFMEISTDKTKDRYRMRVGTDSECGAILEREKDGNGNFRLFLYNLK